MKLRPISQPSPSRPPAPTDHGLLAVLSTTLVGLARTGVYEGPEWAELGRLDPGFLDRCRTDKQELKAFWINVYNASCLHLKARHTRLYCFGLARTLWFFRIPAIEVAGLALSLDHIEHGILRGRGRLPRLARSWALERRDPRIHAAINCGGESCPVIRSYRPSTLEGDLDQALRSYLEGATWDATRRTLTLPKVFRWYRNDFSPDLLAALRPWLAEDVVAALDAYGTRVRVAWAKWVW